MHNQHTASAGEFWFFSQLHRLGYNATITLGNTKAVDIHVNLADKDRTTLSFDVKSHQAYGGSFDFKNISSIKNHFIVFVIFKNKKSENKIIIDDDNISPDCFIVESENLRFFSENPIGKTQKENDYSFRTALLPYLKSGGKKTKGVSENLEQKFKKTQGSINFRSYKKMIWILKEFEDYYYQKKAITQPK